MIFNFMICLIASIIIFIILETIFILKGAPIWFGEDEIINKKKKYCNKYDFYCHNIALLLISVVIVALVKLLILVGFFNDINNKLFILLITLISAMILIYIKNKLFELSIKMRRI